MCLAVLVVLADPTAVVPLADSYSATFPPLHKRKSRAKWLAVSASFASTSEAKQSKNVALYKEMSCYSAAVSLPPRCEPALNQTHLLPCERRMCAHDEATRRAGLPAVQTDTSEAGYAHGATDAELAALRPAFR